MCDRTAAKGEPRFTSVDTDNTRFDFPTPLACQPEPVDCLVTGKKWCGHALILINIRCILCKLYSSGSTNLSNCGDPYS